MKSLAFAPSPIVEAFASVAGMVTASAFMALFLIGFLTQRLVATREAVEIFSKFGPVVWRRFAQMAEVGCITIDNDEGSLYELEVKAGDGPVRFGSESKEHNVRMLAARLCQVCGVCRAAVPPAVSENQSAGPTPKMIPAKTIRRQKKKINSHCLPFTASACLLRRCLQNLLRHASNPSPSAEASSNKPPSYDQCGAIRFFEAKKG
jgi:hypothetical protein